MEPQTYWDAEAQKWYWVDVYGYRQYCRPAVYAPPTSATANTNTTVTVNMPKRVNHLLHLILTLITFGFWLPVWIIITVASR